MDQIRSIGLRRGRWSLGTAGIGLGRPFLGFPPAVIALQLVQPFHRESLALRMMRQLKFCVGEDARMGHFPRGRRMGDLHFPKNINTACGNC
jgi:hypothetical protein